MAVPSLRRALLRSTVLASVALAASVVAPACSAPVPENNDDQPIAETTEAITEQDVISRAMEWVNAKLLYCQSPNHASDAIDPACPAICNRQNNAQWDPYRSDCSGFVSWAWGLPAPGRTTYGFAPFKTDITHAIQASDLQPGDAVNNADHVMLFKSWVTKGSKAVFLEEPGCSTNPDYAHEFTSTVSINGTSIHVSYNGMTFTAIRYDKITNAQYAAQFVKQSWPYASASPVKMTVGQVQKGWIQFKNVGSATWKSGVVKLAPIPRDKASNLQAPSWLSSTRVSTIAKDVPPGGVGQFEWDLDPSAAGKFKPYWGLVAEKITWFAQSGGPADDVIQVNLDVAPAPAGTGGSGGSSGGSSSGGSSSGGSSSGGSSSGGSSSGGHAGTAGTSGHAGSSGSAGHGGSVGTGGTHAGGAGAAGATQANGGSAGSETSGEAGGSSDGAAGATSSAPVVEDAADPGSSGGCNTGTGGAPSPFAGLVVAGGLLLARRRRRG